VRYELNTYLNFLLFIDCFFCTDNLKLEPTDQCCSRPFYRIPGELLRHNNHLSLTCCYVSFLVSLQSKKRIKCKPILHSVFQQAISDLFSCFYKSDVAKHSLWGWLSMFGWSVDCVVQGTFSHETRSWCWPAVSGFAVSSRGIRRFFNNDSLFII